MAKCIVCSKSAGPFYSLHKACHLVYRNTLTCLEDKFTSPLLESGVSSDLIEEVKACRPVSFSSDLFTKLLVKAWSTQAKQCVKSSNFQIERVNNLILLAKEFEIAEQELEPYLFTRLKNIPYLDALQKTNTIEREFEKIPEHIELTKNEFIVWRFENIGRSEPLRTSEERQWTVLRSVMNNMILKSRYKQLPSHTENEGVLIVSNEALYYSNNSKIRQTKFSNIHSITPMKNGVRVQALTSGATPDTYITGDGRFTYTLLQYAQGLNA